MDQRGGIFILCSKYAACGWANKIRGYVKSTTNGHQAFFSPDDRIKMKATSAQRQFHGTHIRPAQILPAAGSPLLPNGYSSK